jgi:hypothetical protein
VQADLHLRDSLYAVIEIKGPGDGLFDDDVTEMLQFLEAAEGQARERVAEVLKGALRIVSVRVL